MRILLGKSRALKRLRVLEWSIENRLFTEWRLIMYGSGVAVLYFVILASLLFKGQWVISSSGKIASIDFGHIWISGNLAQSSDPMRVFDSSAFRAAQLALYGSDKPLFPHFVYPPTFLLFTLPS